MRNIELDSLVIEVTRQCNMHCAHCLRGDSQNVNITNEIIAMALKDVTYISHITFSGGEPGLNVSAIRRVLKYCRQHNIHVGDFFIVTNGKVVTDEFLHAVLDWYLYIEDDYDDVTAVMVSEDQWHNKIDFKNKNRLAAFSFYHNEKGADCLINEGNARELDYHDKREPYDYTSLLSPVKTRSNNMINLDIEYDKERETIRANEPEIYISAKGEVKLGCDNSYANILNYIGTLSHDNTLFDMLAFVSIEDESEDNEHARVYNMLKDQVTQSYRLSLTDTTAIEIEIDDDGRCRYWLDESGDRELLIESDTEHNTLAEITHVCTTLIHENGLELKDKID